MLGIITDDGQRRRSQLPIGDRVQLVASPIASVRNILDFPNEFSPAADIITLDRNYRSTQAILAAAK
jgi:DNA helicase II / ATP-dependent DNA helicase PcrA